MDPAEAVSWLTCIPVTLVLFNGTGLGNALFKRAG